MTVDYRETDMWETTFIRTGIGRKYDNFHAANINSSSTPFQSPLVPSASIPETSTAAENFYVKLETE